MDRAERVKKKDCEKKTWLRRKCDDDSERDIFFFLFSVVAVANAAAK